MARRIAFLVLLVVVGCGRAPSTSHPFTATEVSYDPGDAVRVATIYRPIAPSSVPRPWIFGVHGGAFMSGARTDLEVYADDYCPEGYVVVSVGYHLTTEPGVTWPRPLRDCQAALRFFREHAADYGLDPDRFVVMGGSAGGCLATHLGLEDDPVSPLGRARYVVDIAGEQDLRLGDACMSNDARITTLLLGHAAPWTEDELLGPSNVQRVRQDADFFIVHGTANGDTYIANSDLLSTALQGVGALVEYHRVEGGGMWAVNDPGVKVALRSWMAARLKS